MEQVFEQLSEDSKDFWTPRSIARIPQPTPLEFYRNYVSKNIPVIITNAMDSWPAMAKWTNEYLVDTLGETQVTVDVTPFGYGDAVVRHSIVHTWHPLTHPFQTTVGTDNVFVMPEERSMSFRDFLAILHDPCFDGVPYLSHQNDSLRDQFPALVDDVDPMLAFASEAFGNTPEAVNLWIGDERAVSTMHKDHYEVRQSIAMQDNNDLTPWIPVNPLHPQVEKYPLTKHLQPLVVTLEAGETLYLPSLWYHRATQLTETVAVNYW
ncbi:hypothetical protein DYB31_001796 [Aphanomyces astaci]|uniref:JmjC domain-containing protein n=1 Tax=Aphanomyces astaci TaxID=112090 RepID=A0A397EC21_APHAT|nr:hypothetical protein DYB31_001796 [Aphanomyces astaci]